MTILRSVKCKGVYVLDIIFPPNSESVFLYEIDTFDVIPLFLSKVGMFSEVVLPASCCGYTLSETHNRGEKEVSKI